MASSLCVCGGTASGVAVSAPQSAKVRDTGHSGGLLKNLGEKVDHEKYRRSYAGIDDRAAFQPLFSQTFANSWMNEPKKRTNRLGSLKRLRKLERRSLWWLSTRYTIDNWIMSARRFNPRRSYGDQLRFGAT